MSAPQWMTGHLWEAEGPPGEVNVPKLEMMIESMQKDLSQMAKSLGQYKGDPQKYKPQLENVKTSAGRMLSGSKTILRALGEKV
jgi:hypothetical protein